MNVEVFKRGDSYDLSINDMVVMKYSDYYFANQDATRIKATAPLTGSALYTLSDIQNDESVVILVLTNGQPVVLCQDGILRQGEKIKFFDGLVIPIAMMKAVSCALSEEETEVIVCKLFAPSEGSDPQVMLYRERANRTRVRISGNNNVYVNGSHYMGYKSYKEALRAKRKIDADLSQYGQSISAVSGDIQILLKYGMEPIKLYTDGTIRQGERMRKFNTYPSANSSFESLIDKDELGEATRMIDDIFKGVISHD